MNKEEWTFSRKLAKADVPSFLRKGGQRADTVIARNVSDEAISVRK
jgi:hypothetical protein